MQAAERAAARHEVVDRGTRVRRAPPTIRMSDVSQGQRRDLALENRPAVDDERALVAAAESGGPAAGENRCRQVHFGQILTVL